MSICHAIYSGDQVALQHTKHQDNSNGLHTISLAHITAPRFSSRGKSDPFGFHSREFLRNLVLGKTVNFCTLPSNSSSGDLSLPSIPSITIHIVRNGWARVNEFPSNCAVSALYSQLIKAQQEAKSEQRGIWSDPSTSRSLLQEEKITIDPPPRIVFSKPQSTAKHITSTAQKCIVDHVITGSFIRIIITDRRPMLSISISLAGIQCPVFRRDAQGQSVPDPFAEQAKFFVESRLLHREVPIEIHQFDDKRNCWVGSIRAEQGDLQCLLLKSGLAKLNEHHLLFTPTTAPSLREAEQEAKHGRINIWTDFVPPQSNN
ncbi:hypothetical protein GEMRC1_006176 [Eukaryota sp. GEM-RC1]